MLPLIYISLFFFLDECPFLLLLSYLLSTYGQFTEQNCQIHDFQSHPCCQDTDGLVPFFWGTEADDYLVLYDEPNVLKEGCGESFALFPQVI